MKSYHNPGEPLMLAIRAGFIQQGSNFSAYCRQNGIDRANARTAILGTWNGPAAQKLRNRISKAAGIQQALSA